MMRGLKQGKRFGPTQPLFFLTSEAKLFRKFTKNKIKVGTLKRDRNDLIFLKQKKPLNEQTGKIQTKRCKLLTVFQRLELSARVQERKCDPGLSQELASHRFSKSFHECVIKVGAFFSVSSQVP